MADKVGTSVWFDIPTNSLDKSKQFYNEVFEWSFEPMAKNYQLIATGGEHIGGLSLVEETVEASNGPVIYIKVTTIDDMAKKILNSGGSLASEKVKINEAAGSFQHFRDPHGNRLSLWEAASQ